MHCFYVVTFWATLERRPRLARDRQRPTQPEAGRPADPAGHGQHQVR
jgi:hypothetical protein